MNRVYIAFGSNIGDRYAAIEDAFRLVEKNNMKIIKRSGVYETEPYGYKDQPPFINGAFLAETELNCHEVLERLLNIEAELGRVRLIRWGPRIIDLDIIFFNDEIYNEDDLKVPHPDMHNRAFVLKPLMDICPDYAHPILKKSVAQMFDDLKK